MPLKEALGKDEGGVSSFIVNSTIDMAIPEFVPETEAQGGKRH